MEFSLPEEMKFCGIWRDYQQDFLDEINVYLSDKKLNVVAAPGAGKTTLGIEIVKRLGKPTLVLSPSVTIKNQWKERIIKNFLPQNADTSWISTDIRNIKTFTSTTYQAVHTLLKDVNIKKNFVNELKKYGIKTIVLDESHHLRTEWYQTLFYLSKELEQEDFTIVSLTATPPYDVSDSEWQNYKSLCGPVDVEISIPELVKNNDLCPHQDILWFSSLAEEEKKIIYDFHRNKREFFGYINQKSDLSYAVKTSVFVDRYEENIELIYSDIDFTISLISYLLSIDDMDINAKILTEFLGLEMGQIPVFDDSIAETLFNGILGKHKDYFKNVPLLKSKLKEYNLLSSSNTVDFKGTADIKKIYAKSRNKLGSIKEITKLEFENMKENLREVVLLDYIGEKKSLGLNVLSAFKTIIELEKETGNNLRPAILTGSLIVIPNDSRDLLFNLAEKYKLKRENILTAEFGENEKFLRVETYGDTNLVPVITEMFSTGAIRVLIGTQALLGEGWDAPCVNTLIIASTVGSFMLSNQMRGRALRVDKNNPQKTADIWHLVSLIYDNDNKENSDLDIINRRFNTFEGVSFVDKKIQNGLSRLGYNSQDIDFHKTENLNKHSVYLAGCRNVLPKMWKQVFEESLYTEQNIRPKVYETLQTPEFKLPRICYCNSDNTLYKILKNYIAKKYIENEQKELQQTVVGLLKTLCSLNIIMTDFDEIKVVNKINYDNENKCSDSFITVTGCTNYERNLFIKTLGEFYSIPKNQRYIIKKEIYDKKNKRVIKTKYYTVPDNIGNKQANVKLLKKNLEQAIGYTEFVFTRTPQGRKELLKAMCPPERNIDVKNAKVWF